MTIPAEPDLVRMRAARHANLQHQLELHHLDGLFLLATNAVTYATGARLVGADSGRAGLFRSVAAVVRDEPSPHLFTACPDAAPPELGHAFVHGPLYPDLADGIEALADAVRGLFGPRARIGVDEQTYPMLTAIDGSMVSAAGALAAAKLCKTPDELACIRTAQRINERAMSDVQRDVRPGVRQTDLTAEFLRRIFELGASANAVDPIWQVMPLTKALGPWTTHGDIAYPTPTTDRFLREGDVIWVDTGISFEGYASDFGRTWIVGHDARPTARQQAQFERWEAVVDAVLERCAPGVSALELGQAAIAANGGERPWLAHFYLAHGVGTESAEMPLVGTDLGDVFDAALVLEPGMVLVLEPIIWDDGAAGYRAEDMIAVTDDGWVALSDYPYTPYSPSEG